MILRQHLKRVEKNPFYCQNPAGSVKITFKREQKNQKKIQILFKNFTLFCDLCQLWARTIQMGQ